MVDIGINSGKAFKGVTHPQMFAGLERARVVKTAKPDVDGAVIGAIAPGDA